jgi:uncharacterized membrane protein
MTLTGRLHPLLLHFPNALVIVAAVAELVATRVNQRMWHIVAVANVRMAAIFAVAAAVTGWMFSSTSVVDDVRSLQWHRWVGTAAAVGTIAAALTTATIGQESSTGRLVYRVGLWGQQRSSPSPGIWARALSGALIFCA